MQVSQRTQGSWRFPALGRRGFTLLELMCVIACISVLAGILSAALNSAKSRSHAIGCLNNMRQIQLAWQMYIDDNGDELPLNRSVPSPSSRFIGRRNSTNSWVAGNPKEDRTPANLEAGSLYSYVKSVAAYHCPADKSKVLAHPELARNRSYSMSSYMSGDDAYLNPRVKTQFSEILNPTPDRIFVLIEEHEWSSWNGSFSVSPAQPVNLANSNWSSLPADRHELGCNLSFVDGHIEHWKWSSPKMVPNIRTAQTHLVTAHELRDLRRLQAAVPKP